MEVILLERIERLGQMGDVVTVKPGYARNFLLPQKKALRATPSSLAEFEKQRSELQAANDTRRAESEGDAAKLEGMSLVLIRSAGENGQLYGSVSARDVAAGLGEKGVAIERRQVELAAPIKSLGLHRARVRLHPEVAVEVTLNVAQSADEAKTQARTGAAVTARSSAEADAEEAAAEKAAEKAKPGADEMVEAAEEIAEAGVSGEVAEEFFEEPAAATAEPTETAESQAADGENTGEEQKKD